MIVLLWLSSLYANSPTGEQAELEPAAEQNVQKMVQIHLYLQNGLMLVGTANANQLLTWNLGDPLLFTPLGGETYEVSGDRIAKIETINTVPPPTESAPPKMPTTTRLTPSPEGFDYVDPGASRYLYSSSSTSLPTGFGYFSQKLIFTTMAFSPIRNLSLHAGTYSLYPALLSTVGGKYSIPLNDNIHLAIGASAITVGPEELDLNALGTGSITLKNNDSNVTLSAGLITGDSALFSQAEQGVLVTISGYHRFTTRVAIITENWMFFETLDDVTKNSLAAHALAVRVIGRKGITKQGRRVLISAGGYPQVTLDLGLLYFRALYSTAFYGYDGTEYLSSFDQMDNIGPIPWLDFTWYFDDGRLRQ